MQAYDMEKTTDQKLNKP